MSPDDTRLISAKNGVAIWDGVSLGDHVFVGPNAVFTNDAGHPAAEHYRTLGLLAEATELAPVIA